MGGVMNIQDMKRWNFETRGGEVWVCDGEHEKYSPCDYREMGSKEIVDTIRKLISIILENDNSRTNLQE